MEDNVNPLLIEIVMSPNLVSLENVAFNNNINVEILSFYKPNSIKLNNIQIINNRAE